VVLFLVENVLHFAVATWWLGGNAKVWLLLREPVIIAGIAMWPPFLSAIKIIADVSTGLMSFSLAGAGFTPGVEARASVPNHWECLSTQWLCPGLDGHFCGFYGVAAVGNG
jgi:hypothetical protein